MASKSWSSAPRKLQAERSILPCGASRFHLPDQGSIVLRLHGRELRQSSSCIPSQTQITRAFRSFPFPRKTLHHRIRGAVATTNWVLGVIRWGATSDPNDARKSSIVVKSMHKLLLLRIYQRSSQGDTDRVGAKALQLSAPWTTRESHGALETVENWSSPAHRAGRLVLP